MTISEARLCFCYYYLSVAQSVGGSLYWSVGQSVGRSVSQSVNISLPVCLYLWLAVSLCLYICQSGFLPASMSVSLCDGEKIEMKNRKCNISLVGKLTQLFFVFFPFSCQKKRQNCLLSEAVPVFSPFKGEADAEWYSKVS